tara:strand:- start:51 stop:299 length:249 start_codon:yes stop_codon:yes gene_type:complete
MMKKLLGIVALGFLWFNTAAALPKCIGEDSSKWTMCESTKIYSDGKKYICEWKNGEMDGQGTFTEIDGTILTGQWKNNKFIK